MKTEKLYYSISEVAEMFDLTLSNLRFWEKEIKVLKPKRTAGQTRLYSKKDIQVIKQIKFLFDEGYKLEGVNKKLSEKQDEVSKKQELYERLTNVRQRFVGMIEQIDKMEKS